MTDQNNQNPQTDDKKLTSIDEANFTADLNQILDQITKDQKINTEVADELMGTLLAHQEAENEINQGTLEVYQEVNEAIDKFESVHTKNKEGKIADDVRAKLSELDTTSKEDSTDAN